MSTKEPAEARVKAPPSPANNEAAIPEKEEGPARPAIQRAAASTPAAMPPVRAAKTLAGPEPAAGAPGKARAMTTMQQTVGNARAGQIAQAGASGSGNTPRVQRSPLSERIDTAFKAGNKGEVFNYLRAHGPLQPDSDLLKWLDKTFGPNTDPAKMTDDRWLADQLIAFGAEPRWPNSAVIERQRRARMHGWAQEPGNIEASFDAGPGKMPVKAYYFPGTSEKRAMIIGGVHGTEASGVEVVNLLLEQMRAPGAKPPFYSVIIVPVLFPENLAHGTRTTTKTTADPNRNFPREGESLADARARGIQAGKGGPIDSQGRPIEAENQILIDLIERFQPERIASIHGHSPPPKKPKKNQDMPGIFDDPRTAPADAKADDELALKMAKAAAARGVRVPGNRLGEKDETPHYPPDAPKLSKGVSLGESWGPRAAGARPAMTTITVEVFGNQTSAESKNPARRKKELESIADVLRDIFLGPA